MKKSLRVSLRKVFVSLFLVLYTFVPTVGAFDTVVEDYASQDAVFLEQEEFVPEKIEIEPEIVEEEIVEPLEIWAVDGDTATTTLPVVLGETYVAPQNSSVTVTFTELPEEAGILNVSEIYLTDEEVEGSNAVSNIAYDISTDMVNGTFKYDLTLPSYGGTEVGYVEDRNELVNGVNELDSTLNNDLIKLYGLDHFTVFVVVDDGDLNYSDNGWSSHPSGYEGDHKWVTSTQSNMTATWTYSGVEITKGAIFISWTQWDDHATNATYKSTLFPAGITVDQNLNSSQSSTDGNGVWSGWYRVLGEYTIPSGFTVSLSTDDSPDGNLSADAIAFIDLDEMPMEVWVDDDYSSNNSANHFWGYDAFSTIQEGIDAVGEGGIINVAAGIYTEALVINRPVSLLGATRNINKNNYSVPANYNWNTNVESVINYPGGLLPSSSAVGVDIKTGNVEVNGFVIQILNARNSFNGDNLLRVNAGMTRSIEDPITLDNILVENNILGPVTNTLTQDGTAGRMGLYLASPSYPTQYQGITNSSFSYNKIIDTHGNGNNIFIWGSAESYNSLQEADYTGTVIRGNEISGSHRSGIEIAGGVSNLLIEENWIHDNSSENGGKQSDSLTYGNGIVIIRMGSDKTSTTALGTKNLSIRDNTIENNEKNAIYLGPIINDISITDNELFGNGTNAINIDLEENYHSGSTPVNNIADNVYLNHNNIFNNHTGGAILKGEPTNNFVLDATLNWWGDYTGPSGVGSGIGDSVSANVQYQEWLCEPYYTERYSIGGFCDMNHPELTEITMYVNGVESYLTKSGDTVKILARATDESDVTKVTIWIREYPWNPNNNELISGNMTYVTVDDTWEFEYIVPTTYKDGDTLNEAFEGNYFNFRPYDSVGNSHIGWRKNFTIDATRPGGSILLPTNNLYTNNNNLTVSGHAYDNQSGVEKVQVRLRNYPGNTFRTPWIDATVDSLGNYSVDIDMSSIPDDDYEVAVVVYDKAGNDRWLWPRPVITLDREAPASPTGLQIIDYQGNVLGCSEYTNNRNIKIDWADNTDTDFANYLLDIKDKDGHKTLTNSFYNATIRDQDGEYKYKIRAVDLAGNISTASDWCYVTLDRSKPTVSLVSPIDDFHTDQTSVLQKWTSTDTNISHYDYQSCSNDPDVDGFCTEIYSTTRTTTSRTVNNNNIAFWWRVRAVDMAGNIGDWTEARKITMDSTKPTLTIDSPTSNEYISGQFSVLGTADDNLAGIEDIRVAFRKESDDTLVKICWATYDSVLGTYNLEVNDGLCDIDDGYYLIRIRARDKSNNTKFTAIREITLDNELPTAAVLSNIVKEVNDPINRFIQLLDNFGLDTVCYNVTGTEVCETINGTTYDWDISTILNNLGVGGYSFAYWVLDLAGNRSDSSATLLGEDYSFNITVEEEEVEKTNEGDDEDVLGAGTTSLPTTTPPSPTSTNNEFYGTGGGDYLYAQTIIEEDDGEEGDDTPEEKEEDMDDADTSKEEEVKGAEDEDTEDEKTPWLKYLLLSLPVFILLFLILRRRKEEEENQY